MSLAQQVPVTATSAHAPYSLFSLLLLLEALLAVLGTTMGVLKCLKYEREGPEIIVPLERKKMLTQADATHPRSTHPTVYMFFN